MHALRASVSAALGDDANPSRLAGMHPLEGVKAATRSLGLLEMLQVKTLGNLDELERDELWVALREVRSELLEAEEALAELEASVAGAVPLPGGGPTEA